MLQNKVTFSFSALPWQYQGAGGWHFVSLPHLVAHKIRSAFKIEEASFGRLPVVAKIGNSTWDTAIWFDSKQNTYLLPLKSEVRKKEQIKLGIEIAVVIGI